MPRNYVKKGGHGGSRRGAGRKPTGNGVAERYREQYSILPLDYLLSILSTGLDPVTGKKVTSRRRDRIAIAALPYVSRRLAPAPAEELKPEPTYTLNLDNCEELVLLERIFSPLVPPREGAAED